MADFFAPSYSHENNNAWLNNLIGDIISPSPAVQEGASDSRIGRNNNASAASNHASRNGAQRGRQQGDTSSDRISSFSQRRHSFRRQGFLRSPSPTYQSNRPEWSTRPSEATVPKSDLSALPSDETYAQDTSFVAHGAPSYALQAYVESDVEPILEDTAMKSFRVPRRGSSHQATSLDMSARPQSSKRSSMLSGDTWVASPIPSRVQQYSPYSADVYVRHSEEKDELLWVETYQKTSLGRSVPEKRISDLLNPSLTRIPSSNDGDDTNWFGPHPGVRPLSTNTIFGEATAPTDDDDHEYPGRFALSLIVVGVCLAVFIISVDRNIVSTAIPQITKTFQSYDDIGWYGSAYFLTASAFQPLYGRVYMSFDTRWTFLAALATFELGSLLAAVSPTSPVLILGRAIQGLGSAGIATGSIVVCTHSIPLQGRPVLFAFVGILYGVGALTGPLLGGVFTDLLSWRWAFWINLPVGAITFIAVFFFFKPRKSKARAERPSWIKRIIALDLIGNFILLAACVMLFLALQLSETSGTWNSAPVIGLLCGLGGSIIVFIGWLIYRGDEALLPPKIMMQRTVAASCGLSFFLYGGLLLQAYYLPIWFQAIKGDDAIRSGVNMIPYMLGNALFSLFAGIFVSKNGLFAPPAIVGTAIATVGCGLLATVRPDTSSATWIGYEVLISAGLGLAIQQGFSAVQTALPLEQVPIGTGAVVAAQSLGGAIFVSIGNTILQDHLLNQDLDKAIPGVDVRAVFELGATVFRSVVPAQSLPALINLYNDSLRGVFIAAVPLLGCAFLCSLCMEWRSVKVKQSTLAQSKPAEKA